MMRRVSGQITFITGPARGIGAATARELARRGAKIALAGLEPDRLAALAGELGDGHAWFECDVTNQLAIERAVAAVVDRFGGIDVVVANAGIASIGTVGVTPVEALARVIDVNLTGVIRTVSATLPHLIARRGYYLIVSSAAAFSAMAGLAAYAASKSGVEQFANVLRFELLANGVDVGSAHPSWIDTDLVRDAIGDLPTFARILRKLPGPFGKVMPVDACARAIVDGIERRKRRVYVPRGLAPFALLRHVLVTPPFDAVIRKQALTAVPGFEHDAVAIGRSFGAHSTETMRR